MSIFSFQPLGAIRLTENGREWLAAYDELRKDRAPTFYAKDVWAETLRSLWAGPQLAEAIVATFQKRQDFFHVPSSELRRQIALLLEFGYIEKSE